MTGKWRDLREIRDTEHLQLTGQRVRRGGVKGAFYLCNWIEVCSPEDVRSSTLMPVDMPLFANGVFEDAAS